MQCNISKAFLKIKIFMLVYVLYINFKHRICFSNLYNFFDFCNWINVIFACFSYKKSLKLLSTRTLTRYELFVVSMVSLNLKSRASQMKIVWDRRLPLKMGHYRCKFTVREFVGKLEVGIETITHHFKLIGKVKKCVDFNDSFNQ